MLIFAYFAIIYLDISDWFEGKCESASVVFTITLSLLVTTKEDTKIERNTKLNET